MVTKKPDSDKWVRRDSHTGRYIDKKSERQTQLNQVSVFT